MDARLILLVVTFVAYIGVLSDAQVVISLKGEAGYKGKISRLLSLFERRLEKKISKS